jgi:hypothetical protein
MASSPSDVQGRIAQVDIWRAANALVKQHGEDAAIIAAQRADALLAEGDIEGRRVFKEIVKAINELQRVKAGEGERPN